MLTLICQGHWFTCLTTIVIDLQQADVLVYTKVNINGFHRNSEIGSVLWSCDRSSDLIQMQLANALIGHRFRCADRCRNISNLLYNSNCTHCPPTFLVSICTGQQCKSYLHLIIVNLHEFIRINMTYIQKFKIIKDNES